MTPTTLLPESVRVYADILRKVYLEQPIVAEDWPRRVGPDYFGRLALVKKEKFSLQTRDKKSSSWFLLRGEVDEIPNLPGYNEITIDDVLLPDCTNTVVIDGPPGIGKTTLCRKMLNMWSKGLLSQLQYDLVLHCPLRDSSIAQATTLADLFEYEHNDVEEVTQWIKKMDGKGLLIIFDGWDELSDELRKTSIPAKIIRKKLLRDCSVIVTSRSYASHSLMSIDNNRHIQVIGFSKNEIFTVIIQTLQRNQDLAKELIDSVHRLPHDDVLLESTHNEEGSKLAVKLINELKFRSDVLSLCYVPLVCSMVIFVYHVSIHENNKPSIPETLTKLYEEFILHTIKRHIKRNSEISPFNIGSLLSLPEEFSTHFEKLCQFAYTNLDNKKMTFNGSELCKWEHEAVKENLGLMTVHIEFYKETYQFLHLSIQEFLAAWWIAHNENAEDIFKNKFDDGHFQMCLRFLAGLTELRGNSYKEVFDTKLDITSKWKRFALVKSQFSFFYNPSQDIKSEKFICDEILSVDADNISVLLLHLLYESKNIELCKIVTESINRSMCMFEVGSTLFDVKCFFDFLHNADITWERITLGYIFGYAFFGFYEGFEKRGAKTFCKEVGLLTRYLTRLEIDLIPGLFSPYNVQAFYLVLWEGSYVPSFALLRMLSIPQLKILHLTMYQPAIEETASSEHCILAIATKSSLQELKITYKGYYDVATTIVSIIKGVTRSKSLRSFTLEVDCPHPNSSTAQQIGSALEKLFTENGKLQAISLDIPNYCLCSSLNIVNINPPLTALEIGRLNTKLLTILEHAKGLLCLVLPYPEKFKLTEPLPCPDLQQLFTSHPNLQQLTIPLDTAQSATKLFTTLTSNTTMKGLNIQIEDEIVFSNSMHSLQDMLKLNCTLQFFEIVTPSCLTNDAPDIPIPPSFIFFLTAGLRENCSLQQLGIPIKLPINKQTERLFEVIAKKLNLTELQFYFLPEESCINCSVENKKKIMSPLFYEQALPAISKILMSHKAIKLMRIECEYLNDSAKPNWDEPAKQFCEAVFLHSSLEYIEIVGFYPPTSRGKMLLQNHLEECKGNFYKQRREQKLGSIPVVNMAKKNLYFM
uniref:NACHT domain-containing protein n=1 Tax=Amphimedon queenslandica TaxID=400682 RepID=A0A1X7TZW1_AMPQE